MLHLNELLRILIVDKENMDSEVEERELLV